jgi:hypothetical protein
MTEHRVLRLQRGNREASAEHSKKPPQSHVHQEEQHRRIVWTARRVRESEFLRPTGKIVRDRVYLDRDEGLEAFALKE